MRALSQDGFNVVGHFDSLLGTGQAARNLADALVRAGVPTKLLNVRLTEAPLIATEPLDDLMEFESTIWAVNPERLAQAQRHLPDVTSRTTQNIGYWWWELNQLPEIFGEMANRLDEIWAPSSFIHEIFSRSLPIPVYRTPLVMPKVTPVTKAKTHEVRRQLGLHSSTFMSLINLDLLSSIDRKNAISNVNIYKRAFTDEADAHLVIKTINGRIRPKALELISNATADRQDITVIDENFSRDDMFALIASADALIATHRAEGLGLHLLEAMALGTPVITSKYSGNMDFCDDANSVLIDGKLISAHDGSGQYVNLASAVWFEPDELKASQELKKLAADSEFSGSLVAHGRETYLRLIDPAELKIFAEKRLEDGKNKQDLFTPEEIAPTPTQRPENRQLSNPPNTQMGVNVIGYFEAEFGMGQYARRLFEELQAADIPTTPLLLRSRGIRSTEPAPFVDPISADKWSTHSVNLVVVNADDFPTWAATDGRSLIRDRYTIGVWAWELETFPSSLHDAFDYVDEIWAISRFSAAAISEFAPVPVKAIPPVIAVLQDPAKQFDRASIGIGPDQFLISYTFDYYGGLARKNPAGLIEAFCQAFPVEGEATLVLKSTNAPIAPAARAELQALTQGRKDIRLIDGYWSRPEIRSLIANSDLYVSLHRSEGLGFGVAEALADGTEVIATRYGGNLDFMDETNSHLVDFSIALVGEGCEPYPPQAKWAQPDYQHAADLMRQAYSKRLKESSSQTKISRIDQQVIKQNLNSFFHENLKRIYAEHTFAAPRPLTIYPAEGFSKPEGDHTNPTWWQTSPVGWLAFDKTTPISDRLDLLAELTLINVPVDRPCHVVVRFRELVRHVHLNNNSEKVLVRVPIGESRVTDEIKIECKSNPWQVAGDNREFYLQVSQTKVQILSHLPKEIEVFRVKSSPPFRRRLRNLLRL
jgi:glycosyltransferase involved in cell wall biosynthesis